MTLTREQVRLGWIFGALALALLAYWYLTRSKLLEASNSAYVNGMFDALNPNLSGVKTGGAPSSTGAA